MPAAVDGTALGSGQGDLFVLASVVLEGSGKRDVIPNVLAEAMAMDVDLFVCQSGVALAGMTANDLVPQVRAAGLVSFLADARADDRLLVY